MTSEELSNIRQAIPGIEQLLADHEWIGALRVIHSISAALAEAAPLLRVQEIKREIVGLGWRWEERSNPMGANPPVWVRSGMTTEAAGTPGQPATPEDWERLLTKCREATPALSAALNPDGVAMPPGSDFCCSLNPIAEGPAYNVPVQDATPAKPHPHDPAPSAAQACERFRHFAEITGQWATEQRTPAREVATTAEPAPPQAVSRATATAVTGADDCPVMFIPVEWSPELRGCVKELDAFSLRERDRRVALEQRVAALEAAGRRITPREARALRVLDGDEPNGPDPQWKTLGKLVRRGLVQHEVAETRVAEERDFTSEAFTITAAGLQALAEHEKVMRSDAH